MNIAFVHLWLKSAEFFFFFAFAHYVILYIYHLSSSRVKGDSSTSEVALSPLTREDVASNDYIVFTGTCILEQKNRKYHLEYLY